MSNVFVSAFPAMYQLGLFATPQQDFWRITALTAVGGYFGLFFAAPCTWILVLLLEAFEGLTSCVLSSEELLYHSSGEGTPSYLSDAIRNCNHHSESAFGCRGCFIGKAEDEGSCLGVCHCASSEGCFAVCYWSFMGACPFTPPSPKPTYRSQDWHICTWLFDWGIGGNALLTVESWGWFVELTPAFIGTGMIVGLNVAISYFMGSVLAW
jgi:hypothetical protein